MVSPQLGCDEAVNIEWSEEWMIYEVILDGGCDGLGNSDSKTIGNAEGAGFGKDVCTEKNCGGGGISFTMK